LIFEKGLTFEESFEFVKSKRYCIRPNENFIFQLKIFEQNIKKYKELIR